MIRVGSNAIEHLSTKERIVAEDPTMFPLRTLIDAVKEELAAVAEETKKNRLSGTPPNVLFDVESVEIEASVVITETKGHDGKVEVKIPSIMALGYGANTKASSQQVHKVKIVLSAPEFLAGRDAETGHDTYTTKQITSKDSDPNEFSKQ